MKVSKESFTLIESAIKEALTPYYVTGDQSVVTDIHLQVNNETGELYLFNDEDQELSKVIITEWVDNRTEDVMKGCEQVLRNKLQRMRDEKAFDRLALVKPYSFVLVDDEKETISELMLIDDDTLLLNSELLAGLDEELNDFLEKLMKE